MNLSSLLSRLESSLGRARARVEAETLDLFGGGDPVARVGDLSVALQGAANDLAEAHNDAYRPHLVERREARRRRREIRAA